MILFKAASVTNHVEELKGRLSAARRNKSSYLARKVKDISGRISFNDFILLF